MKKKTPDLITTNKMIETIYEALEHYVPAPLFRKRTFYCILRNPTATGAVSSGRYKFRRDRAICTEF